MKNLAEGTFQLYAAQHYDNVNCTDILEFQDDLNRIKYIKRLFRKYEETGELKERLILNHLILLYNVFEPNACTRMLAYRLINYTRYLKPFLEYLSYWPDRIDGLGREGQSIISHEVESDEFIVQKLGTL